MAARGFFPLADNGRVAAGHIAAAHSSTTARVNVLRLGCVMTCHGTRLCCECVVARVGLLCAAKLSKSCTGGSSSELLHMAIRENEQELRAII